VVTAKINVHETGDFLVVGGVSIVVYALNKGIRTVADPDDGNPHFVAQDGAPFIAYEAAL
jgi:hypothetical protein